jgi:hypothetical protein
LFISLKNLHCFKECLQVQTKIFKEFNALIQKNALFSGPYTFSWFGLMNHLNTVNPINEFKKYKEKYGNIFSFSCGQF